MFIPLHDQNTLKHVQRQYVTLGLITVNVVIWLITATPRLAGGAEASAIYYSYGFVPAVFNDLRTLPVEFAAFPESARYLSYSFFHADFIHLAGNMLFIWVFGDNVEDALGHLRFLLFYGLCAAAGALAHGLAIPASEAPLIGSSGAAAGIVAAYLMLHPRIKVWVLAFGRIPLRLSAMWVLGAWIAFQIFSFVTNEGSEVSWSAHLGGIAAGALLVLIMRRKGVLLFDKELETTAAQTPASSKPKLGRDWGRPDKP